MRVFTATFYNILVYLSYTRVDGENHESITQNSSDVTELNTNLVAMMFNNPVGKTLYISFPLYNDLI